MDLEPRKYAFRCLIDPNPLVPGKYFLRAAIFHGGDLFDHIDEVLSFLVSPSIASAQATPSSHCVGHVYIPYKWEIADSPDDGGE
jgi:hypothetical protein